LDSKDSDALVAYIDNKNDIEVYVRKYSYGLSYDSSKLRLNSISNILSAYIKEADGSIVYKRARNTVEYINSFNKINDMSVYINAIITDINTAEISSNLENHKNLSKLIDELKVIFILMTFVIIALSLVFVYDFTDQVIRPIEILSKRAKEVSKGNYDLSLGDDIYFDEANVLSNSFNDMTINIKSFISELQDKADTESKLRNSEVNNLKMQNLLKQAELIALQTQINPHFLFNTLNAAIGLANLEDAERTSEFLYHLSSLY
jgi:nitrogen fixation/metabolism regulation signal transduction histidine kinase